MDVRQILLTNRLVFYLPCLGRTKYSVSLFALKVQ